MPDVFGFDTAEESLSKIRDRFAESRAQVVNLGRNASPGVQFGSALANIFGPAVQKGLDTRRARKDERDRLMETQGLSKEEARKQARLSISPEFREVRKAKKIEEITSTGRGIVDALVEDGIPADRARAVGMLEVAKKLNAAGLANEATQLRTQASELLQAQQKRELEVTKMGRDIQNVESTIAERDAGLAADDDTFIKIDDTGAISGHKSMPLTDPEGRQALRDKGWINVGNGTFGIQFNREDFAGAPKEVPRGTQEDIIGGLNMLGSIDVMRAISGQTGFVEGPTRQLMANLGLDFFNNDNFVDAVAVRRKMRADIQSIIKGIPSNYDAGIFEKMIPDPGAFKSERFYNAQLDVLEDSTRELVELTIAFHQGTQKPIPKAVLDAAYASGVDVRGIEPMTKEEIERVKSGDDNVFTAHQRELEIQAEMFESQKNAFKDGDKKEETYEERKARILGNN